MLNKIVKHIKNGTSISTIRHKLLARFKILHYNMSRLRIYSRISDGLKNKLFEKQARNILSKMLKVKTCRSEINVLQNIGDLEAIDKLLSNEFGYNTIVAESEVESIYPSSTDNNIHFPTKKTDDNVFLGIATLSSLDFLANLKKAEGVIFVDINAAQLEYMYYVAELIKRTKSREDFLSAFFNKPKATVAKIIKRIDSLAKTEEESIIEHEFWATVSICENKSSENKGLHHGLLLNYKPYMERGFYKGIVYDRLGKNVLGSQKNPFQRISGTSLIHNTVRTDSNDAKIEFSSLVKKNGFLSSNEKYQALRIILTKSKTLYIVSGISASLVKSLFSKHSERVIYFWLSNVLKQWFRSKEIDLFLNELLSVKMKEPEKVVIAANSFLL